MKKNMVSYITVMTNDNIAVLEEIIQCKYRKFTKMYWLLKDFSDFIASIQYKESSNDTLKIELLVSKKMDIKQLISRLEDGNSEKSISIRNKGNRITIEILQDESDIGVRKRNA